MGEPHSEPAPGERPFVSVASRLALMIFALVVAVALLIAVVLVGREHEAYLEAKRRAAVMLTEQMAAGLAPALDFADPEALTSVLSTLSSNEEVLDAAVWSPSGGPPLAQLQPAAPLALREQPALGVLFREGHIDITRAVRSPRGKELGTLAVRVSLAREQQAFAATRRRFLWLAPTLASLVALLLIAVVRRLIVSPLSQLELAARRLGRGQQTMVPELRQDEVGSLARTFNRMAHLIREREERINSMNARLQSLLDHMRQAIVVFDETGQLGRERSRTAEQVFGPSWAPDANVVDLLFPSPPASLLERDAFRAWLSEAAHAGASEFQTLADLAPREAVVLGPEGEERQLELEFRRAAHDDSGRRFLLLATDVTEQRRLERSAEALATQHKKQLAAMRRLLSGSGQAFVSFLSSSRQRWQEVHNAAEQASSLSDALLQEAFRFVHTLRAEARSFGLEELERCASELEAMLAGVRHQPPDAKLRAAAAEQLRGGLEELGRGLQRSEQLFVESSPIGRRVLDQVSVSRRDVAALFEGFGSRHDRLGELATRIASRPFGELASGFSDAVQSWSAREGKLVELVIEGREVLVPPPLCERLGGALAHLLRNAIAHGIEAPSARVALGKPEAGRIELACCEDSPCVCVEVSDDGRGFDLGALRRAAAEVGQSGIRDSQLPFLAGVSTRGTRDELAGHGVGLDAVRSELQAAGYAVRVSSEPRQGARITVTALDEHWAPTNREVAS